jgi:F-type H+-transporting ATPase subunit b
MLEIESGLFFWTTVSFLIMVVLLYRVALPPLLELLAKREKVIAGNLEQAAANQKESEQLLADYRKKLSEVQKMAEAIVEKAREEGRAERQDILVSANRQAEMVMEKNRQDMIREKNRILLEVKGEVAEMVVKAAGRILRKEVGSKDNLRLIEEAINE